MVFINALGRRRGRAGHQGSLGRVLVLCALIMCAATNARAGMWDMDPPPMTDDPQWQKVKELWEDHYWGKNLDELISILTPIRDRSPARVEPNLWLARVHHLHARYHSRLRAYHFDKAEEYAAQACRIDPKNPLAVRMLVDTLFHCRDRDYIFRNYGDLIRSFAPLPSGEALPDMAGLEGWDDFRQLWDSRSDLEKATAAASSAEKMAQENPADALAQTWASRANNYVGELHSSLDRYSEGVPFYKKGTLYAEKALEINPDNIQANFWFEYNVTRTIQYKWLFSKARYLMTLLTPTLFCCREDSMYYYAGPMLSLGIMITNGGWVTEKGMELAGVNTELDMTALELAEILHPDYYFISYMRADLLAYKGKTEEATAILERLLARDQHIEMLTPENQISLRYARILLADIQQNRR